MHTIMISSALRFLDNLIIILYILYFGIIFPLVQLVGFEWFPEDEREGSDVSSQITDERIKLIKLTELMMVASAI